MSQKVTNPGEFYCYRSIPTPPRISNGWPRVLMLPVCMAMYCRSVRFSPLIYSSAHEAIRFLSIASKSIKSAIVWLLRSSANCRDK